MTSVFLVLVLIVKPKLVQAVENLSTVDYISASVWLLREQSSAKRKSLITVSFTFVMALRRRKLNKLTICSIS